MVTLKDTQSSISAFRTRRFLRAQAALRKAVNLLIREYDVEKIVLIGSLADKDRFGFHSDIDLCVEGLRDGLYFRALGEVLSETDDFDIDIITSENAPREMRGEIEKGKVLYEKR